MLCYMMVTMKSPLLAIILSYKSHVRCSTDRPIKITQFYEGIDEFNEKPILTLGEQAKVKHSSKVIPFRS